MTYEDAQKIVYRELGIWTGGRPCHYCFEYRHYHKTQPKHDIPMPPLDDGLLAVILRRLRDGCEEWELDEETGKKELVPAYHDPELWYANGAWNCRTDSWAETYRHPTSPVTAAVMAFAQYLEARK